MGKKKKKRRLPAKSVEAPMDPLDMLAARSAKESRAGSRINEVIQRMSKPETVLEHIQRTGAEYWAAPQGVDRQGNIIDRPCLIVPWDELIRKELEHLQAGGQFGDVYGNQPIKSVGRRYSKSPMPMSSSGQGIVEAMQKFAQAAGSVTKLKEAAEQKPVKLAAVEPYEDPPAITELPKIEVAADEGTWCPGQNKLPKDPGAMKHDRSVLCVECNRWVKPMRNGKLPPHKKTPKR